MPDELDFSVPQPNKPKPLYAATVIILILAVLAVGVANLLQSKTAPTAATTGLDSQQLEQLAGKLAARNLYEQAAATYEQYLATADIDDVARARILYRIGELMIKAERYDQAIAYLYRSELAASVPDLETPIKTSIQECFESAGRLSALRYEIMDRTGFQATGSDTNSGDAANPAGTQIVAEIGAEKITAAELDNIIERRIDAQLSQLVGMQSPAQITQQKEAMLAQLNQPQQKLQLLQSMMAQEALYREALDRKLDTDPDIKTALRDQRQGLLAQSLLTREITQKINITDSDLQTYYQAHQSEFITPARADLSHIERATEQQARDAIARLDQGAAFAELAAELSQDQATKDSGGELPTPFAAGTPVLDIAQSSELDGLIFAAEADSHLPDPVKGKNTWHVIGVRQITPEQPQPFEQVESHIRSLLTRQKTSELQQQFIGPLMDKYSIVIHTSEFAPAAPEPEADN